MHNFHHSTFASGWYQVGWTDAIEAGTSQPLKAFDTHLVMYRTEGGALRIADAFCPHLGAHLGYGGEIAGECLVCPFHGWAWGPDGHNVEIPYSRPGKMALRIRQWSVCEIDGVAMVWYGARGEAPTWEPPGFLAEGLSLDDFWPLVPHTTKTWQGVRFQPQVVTENSCDAAHFKYVHKAAEVPPVSSFQADGHLFTTEVRMRFGGDKGVTWATPNGPVDGQIVNQARGMGLIASEFVAFDRLFMLTATTPVDHETSDHRATVWVPRTRRDGSPLDESIRDRWASQQFLQHSADFPVWENMSYVAKPPFVRDEAAVFREIRNWSEQFYIGEPVVSNAVEPR